LLIHAVALPAPKELFPVAELSLVEIRVRQGSGSIALSSWLGNHPEQRVSLAPGLPFLV